jgi:hypothetical protein
MYNCIMSAPYGQDPYQRGQPWRSQRPPEQHVSREELAATIEARRELGPQYEHALAERLADEIDRVVESQTAKRTAAFDLHKRAATNSLTVAIVSLGAGIPISAICGGISHLPGIVVAWGGIVGVNLAHAWATRRRGGG